MNDPETKNKIENRTTTIEGVEAKCRSCDSKLHKSGSLEVSVTERGNEVLSVSVSRSGSGIIGICKSHHLDYATGDQDLETGDHNRFTLHLGRKEIGFANVSSQSHVGRLNIEKVECLI